jgi:hypothetical protein
MAGRIEFIGLPSNAFAADHPVARPPEDCSDEIVRRFHVFGFSKKHVIPIKSGAFYQCLLLAEPCPSSQHTRLPH